MNRQLHLSVSSAPSKLTLAIPDYSALKEKEKKIQVNSFPYTVFVYDFVSLFQSLSQLEKIKV